ncbi:MAG: GNAT family N-acetyltransferase [Proteobacteria bacterium]|nr:GNAT family N-acetyltransferase [Pseudomonadota bacterium]
MGNVGDFRELVPQLGRSRVWVSFTPFVPPRHLKRSGKNALAGQIEAELASLPGSYAPPGGGVWLAHVDGALAGCVALRPHDGGTCEMKRLWVRPAFRGLGLGRRLAETGIAAARRAGYRTLCLDTLAFMDAARALYQTLGFHEIPAYYDNPLEDVRYLELDLREAA